MGLGAGLVYLPPGLPRITEHLVARIAGLLGKQRPSLEWAWGAGGEQGLGAQASGISPPPVASVLSPQEPGRN